MCSTGSRLLLQLFKAAPQLSDLPDQVILAGLRSTASLLHAQTCFERLHLEQTINHMVQSSDTVRG